SDSITSARCCNSFSPCRFRGGTGVLTEGSPPSIANFILISSIMDEPHLQSCLCYCLFIDYWRQIDYFNVSDLQCSSLQVQSLDLFKKSPMPTLNLLDTLPRML